MQWAEAWFLVGRCLLDQARRATAPRPCWRRWRSASGRGIGSPSCGPTELARGFAAQGEVVRAFRELHHARRLAERLGMARRLGGIDAELARLAPALGALADLDASSVAAEAAAAIDALETAWAKPPEAPAAGQ
ncbi:MAG: hypothetical protein R3F60_30970 [bacterium]